MQPYPPPKITDETTEPRQIKLRRALLGAFYGLLGGTTFVIVASVANFIFHPTLPLGYERDFYTLLWLWIGLGLTLVGFITTWWYETWRGLLYGSVTAALVLLFSNMTSASGTAVQKIVPSLIIFLPAVAICLPLTLFLRWVVRKHLEALSAKKQPALRIVLLLLLVITLGASGLVMRMPESAATAIEHLNIALQTEISPKSKLNDLPGLQGHLGQSYKLFYTESEYSSTGYDISAVYTDGYIITCTIVVYPGTKPFISRCDAKQP